MAQRTGLTRRLAIASDHAGAALKEQLLARATLIAPDWELLDLGLLAGDPTDDYPDAARLVAAAMRRGAAERGLLICGSGIGVAIAAGKYPHLGAACVHDPESAAHGVLREGLNVLCLGGRVLPLDRAIATLHAFLHTEPLPAPKATAKKHA
jgi:ribose 5-phosphate isomerase B